MRKRAKVSFYSTVDEFKRSGAEAIKQKVINCFSTASFELIDSRIEAYFRKLSYP